jgi:hypothetical protein
MNDWDASGDGRVENRMAATGKDLQISLFILDKPPSNIPQFWPRLDRGRDAAKLLKLKLSTTDQMMTRLSLLCLASCCRNGSKFWIDFLERVRSDSPLIARPAGAHKPASIHNVSRVGRFPAT